MTDFELYRVYLVDSDYESYDPEENYEEGSPLHAMSIFITDSGGEYVCAENGTYSQLCEDLYRSRVVSMRTVVEKDIKEWEKVMLSHIGFFEIRWEPDPDGDYRDSMEYEMNSLNEGERKRKEIDKKLEEFYKKHNYYGLYQSSEEVK